MKKTMNTPGFTAEAALNGYGRYQADAVTAINGGSVQPAASKFFFPNHPLYCLRIFCTKFDTTTDECTAWGTKVGIVNPSTGRCELS
jgi:hypothetical protein